jgi:hypothetical protein
MEAKPCRVELVGVDEGVWEAVADDVVVSEGVSAF